MKKSTHRKASLLLVSCLTLCIYTYAQEISVKGKLVDSASAKPVASATINILQPQTKASKTVIADKNGAFETSLLPGQYRITITHSSFRRKVMPLKVEGQPVDMGNLQLVPMV